MHMEDDSVDDYCIESEYKPELGCIMGASWHNMQVQITISFFGYVFVSGSRLAPLSRAPKSTIVNSLECPLQVFVGCSLLNGLVSTKFGKKVSRGNSQQFLKNQSEKLDIPQTICSFVTVVLWIYKTYVYEVSNTIRLVDMLCAVVFLADKFLRLYNRGDREKPADTPLSSPILRSYKYTRTHPHTSHQLDRLRTYGALELGERSRCTDDHASDVSRPRTTDGWLVAHPRVPPHCAVASLVSLAGGADINGSKFKQ